MNRVAPTLAASALDPARSVVGAACAGMDADDGRAGVVWAAQRQRKLTLGILPRQAVRLLFQFGQQSGVVLGQLEEFQRVDGAAVERFPLLHLFTHRFLGSLRVVPEVGCAGFGL